MNESYVIQGQFDIQNILNAMRQIAAKSKETGADIKAMLKNDPEAKELIKNIGLVKSEYSKFVAEMKNAGVTQKTMTGNMNSMNIAIGQFGYLLSDADMFMVNFRMGLMSIGNNVPMVIQYLQYAKQEASGLNMTLGQAFMQSIKGPGGLLLGVNAAMFGLQLLTRYLSDSKEEANKLVTSIDSIENALSKIQTKTPFTTGAYNIKPEDYGKVIKELDSVLKSGQKSESLTTGKLVIGQGATAVSIDLTQLNKELGETNKLTEGARKKIEEFRDQLKASKELEEIMKKVGIDLEQPTRNVKDASKNIKETVEELLVADDALAQASKSITESENEKRKAEYERQARNARREEDAVSRMNSYISEQNDPLAMGAAKISRQEDEIEKNKRNAAQLGTIWNHTGNLMANAIGRSLGLLKQTDNVLTDILNQLLNMGLNAVLTGLFALLPGGGGFMSGFFSSLGIKMANGGIIGEPVAGVGLRSGQSYAFGEGGAPEMVTPINRMPMNYSASVSFPSHVEFKVKRGDLYAVVKMEQRGEKKFN